MSSTELRYLASREWMESEVRSGRPIQHRIHVLSIDRADLSPQLAERVEAIEDGVILVKADDKPRVYVLDSGIDPDLSFGPTKKKLVRIDKPIVDEIGSLPELPKPTEDAEEIVGAWEKWIDAYKEFGLEIIEKFNSDPPKAGKDDFFGANETWAGVSISLGEDLSTEVMPEDGAQAIRDARAVRLWQWATRRRFPSDSIAVARDVAAVRPSEVRQWLQDLGPQEVAARFLAQVKRVFAAAKAHDAARSAVVSDFETEMNRWAQECGSERLKLGIEDGYRMNARYLSERIAAEAPGMYAMPVSSAAEDWATRASSPSEEALRLRRRIEAAMAKNAPPNLDGQPEAEIVIVKKPPHQIYLADEGLEVDDIIVGTDLPARSGWHWYTDFDGQPVGTGPDPFEAVVVKHWLGRFHLIGAVADESGNGPAGVWAVPDIAHYGADGAVVAQDPDNPPPAAAKRKPAEADAEDDIPF